MARPQLVSFLFVAACGSMILMASAADPRKPASSSRPNTADAPTEATTPDAEPVPVEDDLAKVEEEEDKGPWEVTHQVELVYREKLEFKGQKTAAAKVQLKNISETDLPGKLVLVIDGVSQDGFALHEPNGKFTDETPYLQMVPAKRSLEAGEVTPPKSLILTRDESTENVDPSSVELRWRAFTLTKPASLEEESDADDVKVPGKGYTWGEMRSVMAAQDRATADLIVKHKGAIVGTGTAEDENGNLVIHVYAAQGGMSRKLPGNIEGIPVEVRVTGNFTAGPAKSKVTKVDGTSAIPLQPEPDTGESTESSPTLQKAKTSSTPQVGPPTRRFLRPVPIGVSAFNSTDVCASGTLGCRCIGRDGRQYILSNNHVFSEQNAGLIGDPITQPSIGDNACGVAAGDTIATLYAFQRVQTFTDITTFPTAPVNIMDAAVGLAGAGQVDVCTPKEGYGTPSKSPQEKLTLGMQVQKYGRTTSFTKGKIVALNTETIVAYANGIARFRTCINVQTQFRSPRFSTGGDSGSLVVTVADRRPIGLLFAGGGYDTIINPISPILHRFKMGVDDGTGGTPILGSGRMGTASGPLKPAVRVILQ